MQARRERLTELVPQVGPVAFARDRMLPVVPALQPLLPDGGLVRGSVVGCTGATGVSVALATMAGASAAGSWLACVGLPSLGLRAASEVGIALERLMMVAEPDELGEAAWATMLSKSCCGAPARESKTVVAQPDDARNPKRSVSRPLIPARVVTASPLGCSVLVAV